MKRGAVEILKEHGITVTDTKPGRYYTTCPKCSKDRTKPGHKAAKCLGVTIESDGSVHWGCNHGCGFKGGSSDRAGDRRQDPLVTHDYQDGDGNLLFQKVRNPPGSKTRFYCRRPNGQHGGWINDTKGIKQKPLYRWPEVLAAMELEREIAIVEGEKDADNLWRIGIPATCNFDGAAAENAAPKWKAEYSEQLRGARLVVFNDNDAPGYAHADTICRLSLGIAKRVRRLDLARHWPDIPKGGDVSDWLAIGGEHTAEKLKALIESAPDYVPPEQKDEPPTNDAPIDEDAELERLAKLSAFDYERARKAAADALKVRAPILDRLVTAKRTELGLDADDGKQGKSIAFPEPELWPQPVEGVALLDELAQVGDYVVMAKPCRCAVALWVVHSYLLGQAFISPRLAILSPTKQCGKTRLLNVMTPLVYKPLRTDNITTSALFRVVSAHRPSLLIDEADSFATKDNDELRGILNSGHQKGGQVLRNVGDEHEPRAFDTYAATAIAAIGTLPDTVMDRSIIINLAKRKADETIRPFRLDRTEVLQQLGRRVARWAHDNADAVGALDPVMPPGIADRVADNWRSLLAIADVVGGEWPERARQAALAMKPDVGETSRTELLICDIAAIFTALGRDRISSAELIEELCKITPRPWSEYGRSGKPITQNKLARLLKPLGIVPVVVRIGSETPRGYERSQFDDAFSRYSPEKEASNRNSASNADTTGTSDLFQTATGDPDVAVWKSQKSNNDGLCGGVADEKGDMEAPGISGRVIDTLAAWYDDTYHERRDEPGIEAWLDRELRHRLCDDYGVLPEFVETEAKRVIDRVFKLADAATRDALKDIPF
jgi:putative DNA primase/helicase